MRSIAVVSVSRSDYGIYKPILKKISQHSNLTFRLWVGGMHLCPEFGMTVQEIEADRFSIEERIPMNLSNDAPEGAAKTLGLGVLGFAQALARHRPDILLVLGDRLEMMAAVLAAVPFVVPIAHLHGGESTEGAIDEVVRHSISKMSHLHFVATDIFRRRLIQMGEEPWRVIVSGAPSLDKIKSTRFAPLDQLEKKLGIILKPAPLLVTFHPETLQAGKALFHAKSLLRALEKIRRPIVITGPNADVEGRCLANLFRSWARQSAKSRRFVDNLGSTLFFSMMHHGAAMVGNSSSGIIEAGSFCIPVVNIGDRQAGRPRGAHVIDVPPKSDLILSAIRQAESLDFRKSIRHQHNLYGDGRAAERIVSVLAEIPLGDRLLRKRFFSAEDIRERT